MLDNQGKQVGLNRLALEKLIKHFSKEGACAFEEKWREDVQTKFAAVENGADLKTLQEFYQSIYDHYVQSLDQNGNNYLKTCQRNNPQHHIQNFLTNVIYWDFLCSVVGNENERKVVFSTQNQEGFITLCNMFSEHYGTLTQEELMKLQGENYTDEHLQQQREQRSAILQKIQELFPTELTNLKAQQQLMTKRDGVAYNN